MTIEKLLEEYPLPIYEWKNMPQDSPTAILITEGREGVFVTQTGKLSSDELKVCLAHEEGHFRTGTTHRLMSPLDLISQHEYKANAYAYSKLIPMNELMDKVSAGTYNIYELSDHFGVPVQFLCDAVTYYIGHDQGFSQMVEGLKFNDLQDL